MKRKIIAIGIFFRLFIIHIHFSHHCCENHFINPLVCLIALFCI
ncbi:dubious [Schizosaccharomyces pombe]|uniref:Putative uncharacterized protein C417.15 n=1 Tax=Schizosaccharomyces pombe (strain 972 / ATCC 24843) TaxID=284812 RepID=YC7F_SCHPO|nr:uncharacterized protein SPCC417.15 [Schizosaccharomyces pombe]A6X995.1 RecName: Full=Putative uncharacterized protein C417.15; Flags: Precursor [Schizosaccharomyces pombe 972h-]CAO77694.1 dubious [Schizosaccharomyces pombe]|eukprot:NP_001343060.1 uncharacterized protein SPCC417.15 [Schizosaccharomyces pombe]